jgi:hypothetical protein
LGTLRGTPELVECLARKVVELARTNLTHGQVLRWLAHTGLYGQRWVSQ